jgi:hypothetical protein
MQYFSIKTSPEKKIIGTEYPQIQTMDGTVNRKAPNSLYNVNSDAFPNFVPNLNYFLLHKNAKLSDVLSAAMISYGFILNDKVKSILQQHKLPPHEFYPATVNHNGRFYNNYFWFFYISDVLDFIDYDKTRFFVCDMVDNKIEDCKIIHSADLLRNLKEILPDDRKINSDLVFFKKTLIERYDLFKITFGDYRSYISERLYDNLKNNNITGFNISATEQISV